MATMTVQDISTSGVQPSYSAVADGDVFANSGNELLHVKNGSASSITVTITPQRTSKKVLGFGTMTKDTVSVAVPAGEERMIGPFEAYPFNNTSGQVTVNYSAVTTVTAGAFKLPTTN